MLYKAVIYFILWLHSYTSRMHLDKGSANPVFTLHAERKWNRREIDMLRRRRRVVQVEVALNNTWYAYLIL